MTTSLAWHGDPVLKAEVLERMRKHREADEIVQGLYQLVNDEFASGYKGCLIGCTLPKQPVFGTVESFGARGIEPQTPTEGWHGQVEELYGIPRAVGHLLDRIFEGLPVGGGVHAAFAVASIDAVPVGADLSLVSSQLMLEILADPEHGVCRHTAEGSAPRAAVDRVIGLYRRHLSGDELARQEWVDARKAAYDAYAADAAAYAAYAAYAAADADAYAAAYAAYAAADAAAYAAYAAADADARSDWWAWAAERLLHHLTNAPIPTTAGVDASGLTSGV